jgi:hypothetical protein
MIILIFNDADARRKESGFLGGENGGTENKKCD